MVLEMDFQTKVFGITLVVMQFIRELVTVYNWWADRQAEKAKSEGDLTKPATRVEVSQVKEDLQAMGDSLQRQLKRMWALQTHERGSLPAFYVQVRFTEDTPGTAFVGGETHPNFVALTIYHIARAFKSDESKQQFLADVDTILNPVFESKGMDWEYWITEVSRDLWKLNGLVPPPTGSEGEKKWAELNKAVKL
ncbi:unnamed protein product [Penicillium palitans]